MDVCKATEQAYKNGYNKGIKDFAERMKEYRWLSVADRLYIDNLLKELENK